MKFRFKSEESLNQFITTLEQEKAIFSNYPQNTENTQTVIDLFSHIRLDVFEGELLGSDLIGVNDEFPFDDNDSFIMFEDEINEYLEIVQ
ncbi:hypothetical protein 65p284 [Aeromonas phage 65]|uniref:Uncharacterized protein n=2 Tax=Ishigurovirus osborne TaxID=260149 RepID=A0A219YCC7_9CAUD|nr:hypothetical protein ST65p284 [Aeromonas phage 65]ADQ53292.1 hypothetical protein 65p284 [Aeromonas phage 65]APU01661.1 hypothetical protein [Aeromonas phage 65.2]